MPSSSPSPLLPSMYLGDDTDVEDKDFFSLEDRRPRTRTWTTLVHWIVAGAMSLKGSARNYASAWPMVHSSWTTPEIASTTSPARSLHFDGLRGLAALSVVFLHLTYYAQADHGNNWPSICGGWGFQGTHNIASLPLIGLFFHGGTFAVSIFFVLSGYVLTAKPLSLIKSGNSRQLMGLLSSSIFRRWFRLFLPLIAVDMLWLTSWHLLGTRAAEPGAPGPLASYAAELARFLPIIRDLSNPFTSHVYNGAEHSESIYNIPSWTLAHEFRGSVLLFAMILAVHDLKPLARFASNLVVAVCFISAKDYPMASFMAGFIYADIEGRSRDDEMPPALATLRTVLTQSTFIWYMALLSGLYLGSTAAFTGTGVSIAHLVGASLVIVSVARAPACKRFLDGRICQYLGRVSFSLYLTHLPMLGIVGGHIYAIFGRPRGKAEDWNGWANLIPLPDVGPVGMQVNAVVPSIITIALMLVVSEVTTTWIDEPSVRLAKRLHRFCLDGRQHAEPPAQTLASA